MKEGEIHPESTAKMGCFRFDINIKSKRMADVCDVYV